MANGAILLYDGTCGFCDRIVQFVLRHDKKKFFRFAPLQGDFAKEAMARHGENASDLNTMGLVLDPSGPDERILLRGRAALTTLSILGGFWSVPGVLRFLPRGLIDFGYNLVARNRYRIAGRLDSCRVPSAEDRARFIG